MTPERVPAQCGNRGYEITADPTPARVTCGGKVTYPTRAHAKDARDRLFERWRRQHRRLTPLDIYHCRHHQAFHLGRDPKKARRPRRYTR